MCCVAPVTEVNFSDPTIGTMSCYYVRQGSYVDGSIAGETCALVQAEAAKTCCELNPGFSQCLLCGDGGVAFPDATFTRLEGEDPVSCSFIGTYGEQGYLNATECEYFKSLAGPVAHTRILPPLGHPLIRLESQLLHQGTHLKLPSLQRLPTAPLRQAGYVCSPPKQLECC